MSIATAITALQSASSDIASAIEAKGVTVPSGSGFDDYAGLISNISGGGGAEFDDWVKDGDTHLWIKIVNDYQLNQQIRIQLIGTIDWGDGSAKETANVSTYTTFTHTYTKKGRYRIDLHRTSGTFYLGGNSNNYSVMGERSNSAYNRTSALYQAEIGDGIASLRQYSFGYCSGLKRVYIPKNITALSTGIFFYCYSLSEVIFEDPLTITTATLTSNFHTCYALQYLTPFCFEAGGAINMVTRNCYSLAEFTIPSPATSLAANTFHSMYSLKHLWCLPTTAPTAAASSVFTNLPSDCVIHVPYGSLSSYQGASYWSAYSSQMEEGATIKYTLTNVTRDNITPMVAKNTSFTTNLEAKSGYTLGTVTVKMGGTDITSSAYSAGVVTIALVTGNIIITASAS